MSGSRSGTRPRGHVGRAHFGGVSASSAWPRWEIKWADGGPQPVVNVGLQHILTATFSGGPQVTTWYMGLTHSSTTPAAADTMASHAGLERGHEVLRGDPAGVSR